MKLKKLGPKPKHNLMKNVALEQVKLNKFINELYKKAFNNCKKIKHNEKSLSQYLGISQTFLKKLLLKDEWSLIVELLKEPNTQEVVLNNIQTCEQLIAQYKNMLDIKEPIMTLAQLEKEYIIKSLSIMEGNKSQTAKSLGITIKTLYNKLHFYGLI